MLPSKGSKLLNGRPLAVFSDFDGTIAHPDTINFLTERFAGAEFRQEIARQIFSGQLSLRDAIQREVGVIQGTLEEVLGLLVRNVEVDRSFADFALWCFQQGIPLTVLSGGMRQVIETLLRPLNLPNVRVLANEVRVEQNRWRLEFLDATEWGHDKGAALRQARNTGQSTVFLGDGFSDRRAAAEADVVFAKAGLARFCQQEGIAFREFADFSEVLSVLRQTE
ncbi:MAG: HAD-IB family phosphatase [Acidimicrobiia bacterium]|nr:HAD-IB family phosphatase [Acidimicrobiia bacterium]